MAFSWTTNFFIPIIKIVFVIGIIGFFGYVVGKGFNNAWQTQWKFIWKYKIRKNAYPEKTVAWCLNAIENGIGYYEIKKKLLIKGVFGEQYNETLWIYDQLLIQLQGGKDKGGRKYERISGEIEKTKRELPTVKENS